MLTNVLRNSVEIRFETRDVENNKTYVEVFYAEIADYSYLGKTDILKYVKVYQILELDKYIKTGDSERFERVFNREEIPPPLEFYIKNLTKK